MFWGFKCLVTMLQAAVFVLVGLAAVMSRVLGVASHLSSLQPVASRAAVVCMSERMFARYTLRQRKIANFPMFNLTGSVGKKVHVLKSDPRASRSATLPASHTKASPLGYQNFSGKDASHKLPVRDTLDYRVHKYDNSSLLP
jgi:hypothetical protein